jgi:hypothetical protein
MDETARMDEDDDGEDFFTSFSQGKGGKRKTYKKRKIYKK